MNLPVPASPWSAARRESAALEVYLLGTVDFDSAAQLQDLIAADVEQRTDRMGVLLICEHPPTLTLGRAGTISDVLVDDRELISRQISFRRVARGGGALVHAPGQLAVYPILPLDRLQLAPTEFARRLTDVTVQVAGEQRVNVVPTVSDFSSLQLERTILQIQNLGAARSRMDFECLHDPRLPVAGAVCRCGQLAWIGASVRDGITQGGFFMNVSPVMGEQRLVRSVATNERVASLAMQKMQPVTMHKVREATVRLFAEIFVYSDFHIYTRHPLLQRTGRKVVDSVRQ